jgi:Pectate lyase superfamily protein
MRRLVWSFLCLTSSSAFFPHASAVLASTEAAAQVAVSPVAAKPAGSQQATQSPVPAPSSDGGVTRTLLVTAPPFKAKCDGVTDDKAGIQAAFDEALAHSEIVQFPPGTCLTSTIVWKGQPFFGAGISATAIRGKPGQDVFQTPDGNSWNVPKGGTLVHDLKIEVDNSTDASSAPQGNGTFSNRIAGTLGGLSNPVTPAISPGPEAFGTYEGVNLQCSGTIESGSLKKLTFAGAFCSGDLRKLESWRIIGAPITVNGVGVHGSNLTTTIASVLNANTLTLTDPAATPGTNLSGTYLKPVVPPWYMGNCGFAFPDSDGSRPSPNLGYWTFQNILIIGVNGPSQGNHSCGMFVQAPPYGVHYEKLQIQGLWGGYVEALPAINPGGSTWTGDTSSFKDMDLQFDLIPFVIMGGNHRTFTAINIYGGMQHQTLGPMWLHPGTSATISRLYFECQGANTGEIARFTGNYGFSIEGGSLDQCLAGAHYVLWNASKSNVNAQIAELRIAPGANQNTFTHTALGGSHLQDNGLGNSVETNGNSNPQLAPRSYYANRPQEPLGKLDGSWLLSGNSTTPFTSGSDLMMTCSDFNFSTRYNPSTKQYENYCQSDPKGKEVTEGYFHATSNSFNSGWNLGPGPQGVGPNGRLLTVGDRLPRAPMSFLVLGRCDHPCTQRYTVSDRGSSRSIADANLSFDSNWTIRSIPVDLSSVPEGDQITVAAGSPWSGGASTMDTALWAFAPVNVDTIKAAVAASLAAVSGRGGSSDLDAARRGQEHPPVVDSSAIPQPGKSSFSGTTNPIGGTALRAGQCIAGTAKIPEARVGMAVTATPSTDPGDGFAWRSYVSAQGTITVKLCGEAGGNPAATVFNVRVIP